MKLRRRALWLLLAAATLPAVAAEPPAPDVFELCAGRYGGPGAEALRAFDRELRTALRTEDAAVVAVLAEYPLSVHHPDGANLAIAEPTTVQLRFGEIFPAALRKRVVETAVDELFCNGNGVMYGNGELWVGVVGRGAAERYAIESVTLPGETRVGGRSEPRLAFVCRTERHRVLVDLLPPEGAPRYRVWNHPRSVLETPDLEIPGGRASFEGSAPCAYVYWTFARGEVEYTVRGLGCDEETPPPGVAGKLEVRIGGEPKSTWWCY